MGPFAAVTHLDYDACGDIKSPACVWFMICPIYTHLSPLENG